VLDTSVTTCSTQRPLFTNCGHLVDPRSGLAQSC
jgi:hypothetical protein